MTPDCRKGLRARNRRGGVTTRDEMDALLEDIDRLEAELKEWQDYWGCESPHDTHVQAGTTDPYVRQLSKEQARANQATHRIVDLEAENKKLRDALEHADCEWCGKSFGDLSPQIPECPDCKAARAALRREPE